MSTVYLHEMSAAIDAKSAARAYPFDPISAGSHNPVSYRGPGTDLTPADTSSVKSRRPDSRVKEGLSLFPSTFVYFARGADVGEDAPRNF